MLVPGNFNAEHQADFGVEGHADGVGGRTALSEVYGGKDSGVKVGKDSGVPFFVIGGVVNVGLSFW